MGIEASDERAHDSPETITLVEGAKKEAESKGKRVSKVIADSGYSLHEFFSIKAMVR